LIEADKFRLAERHHGRLDLSWCRRSVVRYSPCPLLQPLTPPLRAAALGPALIYARSRNTPDNLRSCPRRPEIGHQKGRRTEARKHGARSRRDELEDHEAGVATAAPKHIINIVVEVDGKNKHVQFDSSPVTGRAIRERAGAPLTDDLTRLEHG